MEKKNAYSKCKNTRYTANVNRQYDSIFFLFLQLFHHYHNQIEYDDDDLVLCGIFIIRNEMKKNS